MTFSEEEMAQYQRLSNEYVPETEALAQKFLDYRTLRGDGNCGWRALAFGYFEALVRSADPLAPLREVARLTSLNNLLDSMGYARYTYVDFVDETIKLLKQIANSAPNHDREAALLLSFNTPEVCNGIIMHFRLITAAWMKSNPERYMPYLEGITIEHYCVTHIDAYAVEIDHIGLQACIDSVLQPAGIVVQVLYLDQSAGEQGNEIDLPSDLATTSTAYGAVHTIRLLYRPGHYDLLYKPEDSMPVLPPAVVTNPEIHLMTGPVYMPSSNICYAPQQGLDLNSFYLPGFMSAGISSMPFTGNAFSAAPAYAPSSLSVSPSTAELYSTPYSAPPQDAQSIIHPPRLQGLSSTGGFRPSEYQLKLKERQPGPLQTEPCQTEAMKQYVSL
ncbi:MAG: hypothetical protein Q9208_000731 [Pyrenodesmia sp. 3 TL-2023]